MGQNVKIECDRHDKGSVTIDGQEVLGVHKVAVDIDVTQRKEPVEIRLWIRAETLEVATEDAVVMEHSADLR